MPIKQNAKKYMRVTARKTARNRIIRGNFRTAIKNVDKAIGEGNFDKATEWFKKAQKALDKASQKNVIKKNTASRTKSRLNARIKKAKTAKK